MVIRIDQYIYKDDRNEINVIDTKDAILINVRVIENCLKDMDCSIFETNITINA